jgi:superfamily I DNA and/or RNA helicase
MALNPPPPVIKFARSFRLHAAMAEFLRREIYSKDAIAYHSLKQDLLAGKEQSGPFLAAVLHPDYPLVVITHSESQSQTRNPFEQKMIGPILESLATVYELDAHDGMGVVVPHRAQRAALQQVFARLKSGDSENGARTESAVDTVERFQGGERQVILVSATESDKDYLLQAGEFLYDPRRLTVAISRAKRKMILVAAQSIFTLFSPDEAAFANSQIWKNLLRHTCTVSLWKGEIEGQRVEVWGNNKA